MALADLLAYDGPGKRYTRQDAEAFRQAVKEGLCEPIYDEDDGYTFALTDAGLEIIKAGGSVAGKTLEGKRLN